MHIDAPLKKKPRGVITITMFASIGLAIVASVLYVPAIRRFQ
jgi:hypothetical protein